MLTNVSKVLIVDNEENDLNRISSALNSLGLATLPIHYSISDPPRNTLTGIRLAFFDIKLFDGAGDTKQIINSLAQAIKDYIDKDNGPYILIFWTSNEGLIQHIKDYIEEREKNNIPKPFLIECIDKNYGTGDPQELRNLLSQILSHHIVQFLLDYESKISFAAGRTLNSLFQIISNGKDKWGENQAFAENLPSVLSTIAKEAVGFHKAKEDRTFALKRSLEPILFDEIQRIELSQLSLELLSDFDTKKKAEIVFPENFNQSLLNNIFHIEDLKQTDSKTIRGGIYKLQLADENYKSIFGFSKNGLLKKFFNAESVDTTAEFVLIEISASCDYIHKKERLFKYILGIKSSDIREESYLSYSDSLLSLPLFFNGTSYRITLNFHFPLSLPLTSKAMGEPIIRIKSDLIDHISQKFSQYISRTGIIQF